ncbi:MAG: hypothetical protein V7641_5091 [Blastocatellia bacterium]
MSKQDIEQSTGQSEESALALARLIEQQQVTPIDNLDALSDLWPADDDPDQLMQYILDERKQRRELTK